MYQTTTQEKSKPLTYEQIRDIVLDKKEDVKQPTRRKTKFLSRTK